MKIKTTKRGKAAFVAGIVIGYWLFSPAPWLPKRFEAWLESEQ